MLNTEIIPGYDVANLLILNYIGFGKKTSLNLKGVWLSWEGNSEIGRVCIDGSIYAIMFHNYLFLYQFFPFKLKIYCQFQNMNIIFEKYILF